ncbi:MAG TPA: HNH endonuclease [Flavobacterium sp.]|jgi:hypothetical protein
MLRYYPSEEFREISFEIKATSRYAISNYGRLLRFKDDISDGELFNIRISNGYRYINYYIVNGKGKRKSLPVYKLVAQYFIPRTSDEQIHVLHLDHNRSNDHVSNLKWATRQEMLAHTQTSPRVIAAKKNRPFIVINNGDGKKLTSTQVIRLKKRLLDPNRKTRIKMLAKEFGVSEMQIHRIKTGENWGHIKV